MVEPSSQSEVCSPEQLVLLHRSKQHDVLLHSHNTAPPAKELHIAVYSRFAKKAAIQ